MAMDILEFMKRRSDFQSLLMSCGTVLAGTAAAVLRGNMEILAASICLLFGVVTQLGSNLYHFYRLARTGIADGPQPRIRTSRLQSVSVAMRLLREGSMGALLLSLMLGFTIMMMASDPWWPVLLGIILYGLVWIMSHDQRSYTNPFSLIVTYLIFGPLGVIGTALVQIQHEAATQLWSLYDILPAIFLSLALGFLAVANHLGCSYMNGKLKTADLQRGCVKIFGFRGVEIMIGMCGIFYFAIIIWMVFYVQLSDPVLGIAPAVPGLAMNTYIAIRLHNAAVVEVRHLSMLLRLNYFLSGLLFFIVWWMIGSPDDSLRVLL